MSRPRGPVELAVGQYVVGSVLVFVMFVAAYALVAGTAFFVRIGLSRPTAGALTTGAVALGAIAGLCAFARYGIDW